MKKSAVYSVISAVAACVFLFSTGMTYASWYVQDDTINKVTMASVRGQIVEEYVQDTVVYPGGTVNKIVQVKNTGTIDALPRVRIDKAWGDSRDAEGHLIVNPNLSTDNIQIAYNTEDWVYKPEDGYFYYSDVLKPGEMTVSLFDSFTIDEHSGGEYKNKYADIVVSMEIIQVEGDALSFWDMSFEDLGITYRQTEYQDTVTTVVFRDNKKGFTFDVNEGDLFANFKDLIPGESRSQRVTVTNQWDNPVEIFFWADFVDQEMSEGRTGELVIELLHEHANIVITEGSGCVIYDGPIWGSPDVDSSGTDSMKYPYSLGTFASGQTKNINVSLYLDPKMDNELLELLGLIKWVFSAQGDESAVVEPPTSSDVVSSDTAIESTAIAETIFTDNSSNETNTTAESVSTDNSTVGTGTVTTTVSTGSSSNGTTEAVTTTVSTGSSSNGTETATTTVSTGSSSNGTETATTTVSTDSSSNGTETATTTVSTDSSTNETGIATTASTGSTSNGTGIATTASTGSTSNGTGIVTTTVSTSSSSNGTGIVTTTVSTSSSSNGTGIVTTTVSTSSSSNGTATVTTTVSTGITTGNSSSDGSETTSETIMTTTYESSDSSETNSSTTTDSSVTSTAIVTTGNSTTPRPSGGSSLTSTDYPSSPKTGDSFKIGLYAILAAATFITMLIMYRKAKDESEQ